MSAILDAAVQVLAAEGAQRFTTARVAERAGVSVGSLYQYFPNKAAILFRLQSDEWRRTADLLTSILDDRATPWRDRLRALVRAFLRSECEEAGLRVALDDAAPLYRAVPEARVARAANMLAFQRFLEEALPGATNDARSRAGDLITTTMSRVGKAYSETPRSDAEIEAYADAMGQMFCAYLGELAKG